VVNHKKIKRLMRENGLNPPLRRRFVATTDSDHDQPIFPDRTRELAVIDGPNQLWVAELTYVAIAVGFVYVAMIMDAWSRRIVGYAIGRRIDARLTLAALDTAIAAAIPRQDVSTTRIADPSTPRRPSGTGSPARASSARWAGAAIPMTARWPRA
jgi:putative transposase